MSKTENQTAAHKITPYPMMQHHNITII